MDYNSIINSNNVVLVEFFATWCPHCKRMIPVMEEVKKLLGNRVPVYTIDIDENEKEAEDNKIETIPTFIVYHNGNQVWRHSGEIDKQDLIGHVESLLHAQFADAVGMSTVVEAIAANHAGMRICGISCVCNLAAGMSPTPLSHKEVQEAADKAAEKFTRLVTDSIIAFEKTI